MSVRRREFLLATGAAVSLPAWAASAEKAEYDVVVVGSGASGLISAIRAAENGAKVAVLESLSWLGGSSRVSTGIFGCAGHPIQKALGFTSTPEDLYNLYIGEAAATKTHADEKVARLLADGCIPAADYLASLGVEWSTKKAQKFFLNIKEGHRLGEYLGNCLTKRAREVGVKCFTNTRATELLTKGGKACGVKAVSSGKPVTYTAKAVILATGGFEANPDMIKKYIGKGWDKEGYYCTPGNQGDGQRMAEKAGAVLADMEVFKSNPFVNTYKGNNRNLAHMIAGGAIAVNIEGKRFCTETGGYFQAWKVKDQPQGKTWLVFGTPLIEKDKKAAERVKNPDIVSGANAAELAKKCGMNAENLQKTIDAYREMVKSGKDTEFNRRNPVDVFAGTLYAVPFRAKVQGTFGGVKTNENCEALRADGSVFPGLYAVGEAASCGLRGVNPQTANVVFGSIAGRKACAYAKTI